MPEPKKTKSEKKPQARGFNPHAMAQAQALNQQPDSIPAMMKPGEYVLPPDTVAAMGGPGALDATVAQTHTPANAGAIVPKGFEPRLFFSSGGLAQEEETKQVPTSAPAAPAPTSTQTPRAQFVADQNAKLAAANTKLAERTQEMNARYQPALNSPTNTFPVNRLPVENEQSQQAPTFNEVDYQARVNQIPGYTSPYGNKPSAPRKDNFFQDSELGRNLYNASMALPGVGGIGKVAATGGLISRGVNAGAAAANTASKSMVALAGIPTSTNQPPGAQSTPPAVTPPPAATPQTQSLVNAEEMQRRQATQPTGQQVPGLSGVYKHGEGQYSDNAQGMVFAPGFTGQPSAQNMQAANALASQQQAQSMGRIAMQQQAQQQMQQPRGFAAPQIDHSGNSSASKDELRRLRWAAESAMENAPRKKYAMQDPAVMAYQAALQGDTAARYGGQAALEAKTNDTNAGLQREQMQQDGANQRDAGRLAIDQQRIGMEATTKGFDVRQSQRKENAQLAWEKASPEQRSVIKERYPDLFGDKENKPYSFDVVRGSADPMTGKREGDYAVVFDPNTGKYRQVQVGQ